MDKMKRRGKREVEEEGNRMDIAGVHWDRMMIYKSQTHQMVLVGRHLKDQLVPTQINTRVSILEYPDLWKNLLL